MDSDSVCNRLAQELQEKAFFTEEQLCLIRQRLSWGYAAGYEEGEKAGQKQVNLSVAKKIRVHLSETKHLDFDSAKKAADYLGTDKSNTAKCARKGYKCMGFPVNYI